VEEKIEVVVLKQQHLKGNAARKSLRASDDRISYRGIFEAQPAAEPGESIIFKTMNSLTGASVVEVLKPEFLLLHLVQERRIINIHHPD